MAEKLAYGESSVTIGSGSYVLNGPLKGYRAFSADGVDVIREYCAEAAADKKVWERGSGIVRRLDNGLELLERKVIRATSYGDTEPIDWPAGLKLIYEVW